MASRIQLRRGTAASWTAANPVLALGEPGYETDTGFEKRGDGATAWVSLAYAHSASAADKRFYATLPPYNVKADGKTVTDAAISGGQATLSSASAAFTSADQGKLCVVVAAGTPITGTTSGSVSGSITAIPVNALASAIPPGGVILTDGTHTQQFVTSGALVGATSVPLIGAVVGGLTSPLTTGGATTALACAPLNFALAAGTLCLVSIDSTGTLHTQTFTTAGAAIGATSIPVTSQTPNFTFPESTIVFGSPIAQAANATYAGGSTVKTNVPALSTTIQSVSGGVATLAANAGTTVASGGECFYATDDTTGLLACKVAAEAVNGTVVLPEGDIGISGAFASSVALELQGQGVKPLYGGTTAQNDANFPTIAPYLKGTVLVQCAPNTDILQLTAQGRAQRVKSLGLRFAGRFQTTGHAVNNAVPGGGLSNIEGLLEDVMAFGHDGNHYGFLEDSPELCHWRRLRAWGGGGLWLKTNAGIPGPPGNLVCQDFYSCTYIAGIAQSSLLDASGAPNLLGFDDNVFINFQPFVRIPSPVISNTTPPINGGVQHCLQTFNAPAQSVTGFVNPNMESDATGFVTTWPNGPACWRTNDSNGSGGTGSQAKPSTAPVSGTGYQNLVGKPLTAIMEFILQPKAAASASTTTNGVLSTSATSITVVSSTGFLVGDGIQIGSIASNDLEFAIVATVPDGQHITVTTPGSFGLEIAHASGVTVANGAAVLYAEASSTNSFPGKRWARFGLAIGTNHQHVPFNFPLPTSWWLRMQWANCGRMWTDYVGPFG